MLLTRANIEANSHCLLFEIRRNGRVGLHTNAWVLSNLVVETDKQQLKNIGRRITYIRQLIRHARTRSIRKEYEKELKQLYRTKQTIYLKYVTKIHSPFPMEV